MQKYGPVVAWIIDDGTTAALHAYFDSMGYLKRATHHSRSTQRDPALRAQARRNFRRA
jgi:hypothetical protein